MTGFLRAIFALAALRWVWSKVRPDPTATPAPAQPAPGQQEISPLWMLGTLVVPFTPVVLFGLFEAEDWLRSLGVTFDAADVDVELYKLTAQVIPTLLIAVSIEAGVKWAQDPKVVREQAGIIAGVGLVAMVGFLTSLAAVATNATTDLAFWLTATALFILGMFLVFFPAYGGGKG